MLKYKKLFNLDLNTYKILLHLFRHLFCMCDVKIYLYIIRYIRTWKRLMSWNICDINLTREEAYEWYKIMIWYSLSRLSNQKCGVTWSDDKIMCKIMVRILILALTLAKQMMQVYKLYLYFEKLSVIYKIVCGVLYACLNLYIGGWFRTCTPFCLTLNTYILYYFLFGKSTHI